MLEAVGYLLAITVGVSLGLIGGGGSILTVPILYYLFGVDAELATAYSLFVVGATSVVGTVGYQRRGLLDVKTGVIFAIPAFVGVYATRLWVVPAIPDPVLSTASYSLSKNTLIMGAFAIVMLMAAIAMIRRKGQGSDAGDEQTGTRQIKVHWVALEGLIVGAVTGFVGAGGGFLIIPALVILAGLPMKTAVGTSLMIISAKSLVGFGGDVVAGRAIDWGFLAVVTALAIVGIFIGTKLSKVVPGKKLEPAFGWFVLLMGGFILLKEAF